MLQSMTDQGPGCACSTVRDGTKAYTCRVYTKINGDDVCHVGVRRVAEPDVASAHARDPINCAVRHHADDPVDMVPSCIQHNVPVPAQPRPLPEEGVQEMSRPVDVVGMVADRLLAVPGLVAFDVIA